MKKSNPKAVIAAGIVLLLILLLSAGVLLYREMTKEEGAMAVVRIDGTEVARYALSRNGTYELNGGTNVLVIENGVAYMKEANCPDKVCIQMGAISYNGQCITCLPNRITVTIEDKNSDIDIAL